MIHLYKEIEDEIDLESIACNYKVIFDDYLHCLYEGNKLYKETETKITKLRRKNEKHYHKSIKHQLFSRLQEIKYYSNVNILDTRRLVSVNPDCISTVQILVRDKIYVNVYFRSSDFYNALPVDLEFICSLPFEFIYHLENFQGTFGYDEVHDEVINKLKNSEVQISLMFGSLHKIKV